MVTRSAGVLPLKLQVRHPYLVEDEYDDEDDAYGRTWINSLEQL